MLEEQYFFFLFGPKFIFINKKKFDDIKIIFELIKAAGLDKNFFKSEQYV